MGCYRLSFWLLTTLLVSSSSSLKTKALEKEWQQELQFQLSFRKLLLCLLKRYAHQVYKLINYVSKPKPLRTVTQSTFSKKSNTGSTLFKCPITARDQNQAIRVIKNGSRDWQLQAYMYALYKGGVCISYRGVQKEGFDSDSC